MPSPLHSNDDDILQAERDIRARLGHLGLDFPALMAVSNIYRAATAVRNRVEREVLSEHGLSWGGFTILFVLWVWGPMEAARLAAECGLAKGTLTGMAGTLERRQLIQRHRMPSDRRRVSVQLTDSGTELIGKVFPRFNDVESAVVQELDEAEVAEVSRLLRQVTRSAG
jgi:MarR family transcriptional regulator, organic hydroperoxide resistance regulator